MGRVQPTGPRGREPSGNPTGKRPEAKDVERRGSREVEMEGGKTQRETAGPTRDGAWSWLVGGKGEQKRTEGRERGWQRLIGGFR